jgi:hypothetical protein
LRRAEGDVYIALENSPSGERAKMVTFRDGRDELLPADTVLTSNGVGTFSILSNPGDITTDAGTIVRRHGRLVDPTVIMPADYTHVSLNGGSRAAVVDIVDAPDVSGVFIARGRILSVDQGRNFRVQSMSVLSGSQWTFTPVQREFTIDYNTMLINSDGARSMAIENFIGYTDQSVLDRVYTIVYEGSRAARIIDAPYPRHAVRGIVYSMSGNTAHLRAAEYFDASTGRWLPVSLRDATITVTIPANSIVVKNNSVVTAASLVIGDTVRALTNVMPERMQTGVNINGYMVFVDR